MFSAQKAGPGLPRKSHSRVTAVGVLIITPPPRNGLAHDGLHHQPEGSRSRGLIQSMTFARRGPSRTSPPDAARALHVRSRKPHLCKRLSSFAAPLRAPDPPDAQAVAHAADAPGGRSGSWRTYDTLPLLAAGRAVEQDRAGKAAGERVQEAQGRLFPERSRRSGRSPCRPEAVELHAQSAREAAERH